MASRIKFCAPKPIAIAVSPAKARAGSGLMPTWSNAVSMAISQTALLATLYTSSANLRVCCSRNCSERDWPAAGFTRRLLAARRERFSSSAIAAIPNRCRTIESVDAFKYGTMLDIGDSSGEYNIESASMLAALLWAFQLGEVYAGIQTIAFAYYCRRWGRLFAGRLSKSRTGSLS